MDISNLKELHRNRRAITPDLRRAQMSAARNLSNSHLQEELKTLERQYDLISVKIHNETQQLVFQKFGQEILDKLNRLQNLREQAFTINDAIGQEVQLLTMQVKEVTDLLYKIELGMG